MLDEEQTPEEAVEQFIQEAIASQEEDSDLRPKDANPIYLFNLFRSCIGGVINTHPFSDNELFTIALSAVVGLRQWLINAVAENRSDEAAPWRAATKEEMESGNILDASGKPRNRRLDN